MEKQKIHRRATIVRTCQGDISRPAENIGDINIRYKLKNLLDLITEGGRQRCLRQSSKSIFGLMHVNLSTDLLTVKVDRFKPLPSGPLVPYSIETDSFVRCQSVPNFCKRRTDGRADRLRTHASACQSSLAPGG